MLNEDWLLGYIVIFIFLICPFLVVIASIIDNNIVRGKINNLFDDATELTPNEFVALRRKLLSRRKNNSSGNTIAGVYVLYNKTKNMYYVGQSVDIIQRINNHFTGHGNGDVYADYKYGDKFTIKMIKFENSGFKTLNELERKTIYTYNAFSKGYNKTRGNSDR